MYSICSHCDQALKPFSQLHVKFEGLLIPGSSQVLSENVADEEN